MTADDDDRTHVDGGVSGERLDPPDQRTRVDGGVPGQRPDQPDDRMRVEGGVPGDPPDVPSDRTRVDQDVASGERTRRVVGPEDRTLVLASEPDGGDRTWVDGGVTQAKPGDPNRTQVSVSPDAATHVLESEPAAARDGATRAVDAPTPVELPRPGDRLSRYEVQAEIARGGMGVVLLAQDCQLRRPVAIKMLLHEASPSMHERFQREAMATARLEHPHIVSILDVGSNRGRPFLVMPFVAGESLDDLLQRQSVLDPQRVIQIGQALADAMAYAHDQGILHRDLKPQNVLVSARGHIQLTDFGLARLTQAGGDDTSLVQLTAQGQILGTPAYMAPEQARGDVDAIDARSDVYGLGAVLYECLCGLPPVSGETGAQILRNVVRGKISPLDQLRPDTPPRLVEVVHRCLALEPADRYQTALDVLTALRGCHMLPSPSPQVSRPSRDYPHVRPAASADPDGPTLADAPPADPDGPTLADAPRADPDGPTLADAPRADPGPPASSVGYAPPPAIAAPPSSRSLPAVSASSSSGSQRAASASSSSGSLSAVTPDGTRYGPYVVQEELARGAQGTVYRASRPDLQRPVALKVLLAGDDRVRARFLREGRVLAKLRHRYIPRVHDVGEDHGIPFLALELIEGQNLEQRLKRAGTPDPSWSVGVLEGIARALDYCHGQGALHRDVKPGNIVIEEGSGRPVLVDFGIVRLQPQTRLTPETLNTLSLTGEILGTPAFMAPEQAGDIERGEVSARSDVYGLGATLYFLLTGAPPFQGHPGQVLYHLLETPPPDPRAANPRVPASLAGVCLRAMAKEPGARHPTAAAFADALVAALQTPDEPLWRFGSWTAALVGLALCGLAAVILIAPRPGPDATSPTPSPSRVAHVDPSPGATPSVPVTPTFDLSPAGTVVWERNFDGQTFHPLRSLGRWLVLPSNQWHVIDPGDPARTWQLPPDAQDVWWDAPRDRALVRVHPDEPRLVAAAPGVEARELFTTTHPLDVQAVASDARRLYVAGRGVAAYPPDGGAALWQRDLEGARADVAPHLLDLDADGAAERLVVCDVAGGVWLLDAATGDVLARAALPGGVLEPPTTLWEDPTRLLIGCARGDLIVLRVEPAGLFPEIGVDLGSPIVGSPVARADRVLVCTIRGGLQALAPDLTTTRWAVKPEGGVDPMPRTGPLAVDLDGDGREEFAVRWIDMNTGERFALWLFSAEGEPLLQLGRGAPAAATRRLCANDGGLVQAWGPWRGLPAAAPPSLELAARHLAGGAWLRAQRAAEQLGPEATFLRYLTAQQLGWTPPALDPDQAAADLDAFINRFRPPLPVVNALLAPRGITAYEHTRGEPVPVQAEPLRHGEPLSLNLRRKQPPQSQGFDLASNAPPALSWMGPDEQLELGFELPAAAELDLVLKHRTIQSFGWGYAAVSFQLDEGAPRPWLPRAGSTVVERLALGRVAAGRHVLRVHVGPRGQTPYALSELYLRRSAD